MASFNDAFAALDDYRVELLRSQQEEDAPSAAFAARGAFSAFATPLSNVHATGVGMRLRQGKVVEDDFVIKVYVFDKQDLGARAPKITRGEFQGIGIDVEHLPVQQALHKARRTARAIATTPSQHQQRRRPVVGGLQISPLGANFVGTLGCLVTRGSQLFALSNNHVLADTNRLPIGTQIVQPFGSNPGRRVRQAQRLRADPLPDPRRHHAAQPHGRGHRGGHQPGPRAATHDLRHPELQPAAAWRRGPACP